MRDRNYGGNFISDMDWLLHLGLHDEGAIEMKMGELLSLCRELKGATMRDIEKATGLNKSLISRVENGEEISFGNAVILCDFYGLSIERLAETVRTKKKTPAPTETPSAWGGKTTNGYGGK